MSGGDRVNRRRGPSQREAEATPAPGGHREESSGKTITCLDELPPSAWLDATALAHALGVSKRTIRRMVARYELPPPVRFAGRSTWQVGKVVSWVEARAERVVRAAERDAKRLERLI